jgi:membrane protein
MVKIMSFIKQHVVLNIIYSYFKDFYEKEGFQRASALAYTILVSFVPFLIAIASITTLLLSQEAYSKLEKFLLKSNLPGIGDQIYKYIQLFHQHAGKISILSFVFLFVTSILMLSSLSHHIGKIYGDKKDASITLDLINFGIITIGSLLLSVGAITTSYLATAIKLDYPVILYLLSIILSILAFTLVYKFLSARKVKFKESLICGIVAGLLFEIAKQIFAIYIKYFATENIIYGALATIPIFLLWIYISCLILLGSANIVNWFKNYANNKDKMINRI